MRLSHRDLDLLSDSVRALYSETDRDRLPHTIIALLAKLIPGDSTSYNEFERATGRLLVIIEPELTGFAQKLPAFEAVFQEHPVAAHFQQTRSLAAFKLSDFYSSRQYRNTAIYTDFYRYFEVNHQISLFISGATEQQICMALNRKQRDFSERDRQIAELLRPHLTQALANASVASALRKTSGYLGQAMESCKQGMVWLDRTGKFLFVTDRAQQWLAEYFTPVVSGAVLPEDLKNWIKLHLKNVGAAREPLVVSRGDKSLRIRLIEEGAQMLLVLTETRQTPAAARFTSQGLTPRESEVLSWLAHGKSNPEIAQILTSSPRTIDKHVERVLSKLHVETRKAAMLRAWELQQLQ